MTGKNILKGMGAGFIATLVLSALMIIKANAGMMPQLDVITMLTKMLGSSSPAAGWIAHFLVGTVFWGGLFAWLDPVLPGGAHWLKGAFFATGAWLLMMVFVFPAAGAGFFGANLGPMAAVATFVLHFIFGAVLGGTYGLERPEAAAPVGTMR